MTDYIDRMAVRNELYKADAITMQGVKIINQFPAADVVEVVRCKDCKYSYDGDSRWLCSYGVMAGCIVPEDFYCKCGERKEGKG